jgi:predicted ATPase/transcriptional regulator with XRE-family HTH domain
MVPKEAPVAQSAWPSAFANLLRCHRLALHLTQEALAERAGLSVRAISDLERGINHRPHADTLHRLIEGFELSEPDREVLVAATRGQGEYAFRLLSRGNAPMPAENAATFVGRDAQLLLLGRHLRGDGPSVLLLDGMSGIGISRLLQIVVAGAGGFGLRALVGACHQFGEDALEPVLRALATYAGAQSPAQMRRDLRGCERMLRLLPRLADAYTEPLPHIVDPPERERGLTFDAVGRFLGNIAGPAGTLLVLDDLRWAAYDALHLLAAIVRMQRSQVRVVAGCANLAESSTLARFASDLVRGGLAVLQVVPPLDANDSLRLVRLLVGPGAGARVQDLPERVARCKGVPAALVQLASEVSGSTPSSPVAPPPSVKDPPSWSRATIDARLGIVHSASPLVGREQDSAAVEALLRHDSVRLVTLTGPGGVGKTRLAARVVASVRDLAPDGLYAVSLADLRDAALVPMAIAQALDLRERAGQPLFELIARRLSGKRALLVLDNFEHVLPAAEMVARLLSACPLLTALVTSRAGLRVSGEHEYVVQPLLFPDTEQAPTLDDLPRYAAVDLFVERATRAKPDFRLNEANASAVAAICTRLDGLPLAIELAAARVALLAPTALLARLVGAVGDPPLGLLAGGARDVPQRLQAMRSAIAWSHDLLTPPAQQAFRRLAVCAGGCTVEAAEAICRLGDGMLDALTELTDHSLLRAQEGPGGEVRLTMLATIHSFARECLVDSGEADEMSRRHAAYYATVAEVPETEYVGPRQLFYLARWQREQENLRAALYWAREAGESDLGLRIAGALWDHWVTSGQLSEGRGWLERLLAQDAADGSRRADSIRRAKALNGAGLIAWYLGDFQRAEERIRESVALFRAAGEQRGECRALNTLGLALLALGDDEHALAIFEECLRLARSLEDPARIGLALSNLADLWAGRRDYARAAALLEECLRCFRQVGAPTLIAYALLSVGTLQFQLGARERAAVVLRESLESMRATGTRICAADALELAALIAHARGQMSDAVCLLGAATAVRNSDGAAASAEREVIVQGALEAARTSLVSTGFTAAWDMGATLRLDAALDRAMSVTVPGLAPL